MKICKIKLKNIHSLKGEHTIDFENGVLGDAGLFVITGPTGAGKSTILDVITLALFNRIPRITSSISKKVVDEEGVILTKNTTDCYAEVEYLVNGILYRSNWSIRLTRKNTLAERLHEVVDVTNGNTIISSSISQVPKENERIIGLSYEQFVQSMILAQGQFSKLLLAKRDERNTLLEEITGTGFYRTIGRSVYYRFKEEEKKVNDHQLRMGENKLFSEEEIQLINEKIKLEKPELQKVKDNSILLDSKIKIKESIIKNTQKKEETDALFTRLNNEKEIFKPQLIRLEEHSKFAHLRNVWEELKRKQKENINTSNQLENNKLESITLNTQLTELLESVNNLIKKEVTISNFETLLDHFQTNYLQLLEDERTQKQKIDNENQRINERVVQLNRFGFTFLDTIELDIQIDDFINEIETKLSNKKINTIDDILVLKSTLSSLRLPASQLMGSKRLFQEKKESLEKLKTLLNDQNSSVLIKKAEQLKQNESSIELKSKYDEALQLFEDSKKVKGLDGFRSELQPNCPCPLCGSIEHPFVSDIPDSRKLNVHEENFNNVKKLVELNKDALLISSTEISTLEKSISLNETELKVKTEELNKVTEDIQNFSKQLNWSDLLSLIEIEQKTKEIESQFEELSQLEKLVEAKQVLIDLKGLFSVFQDLNKSYQTIKDQRISIYEGSDLLNVISTLKSQKNKVEQQLLTNVEASSTLSEILKSLLITIEQETIELKAKIHDLGLNQLDELDLKILNEVEANQLRNQSQKINETEVALKTTMDSIEKELVEDNLKDDKTVHLDGLKVQFKTVLEEVELLKKSIWDLENQIKIDTEKREKQKEDQLILDALKRDLDLWSKMNALIGDSAGKKFSNFVQDLTLKQLIEYGNERLKGFSDRYLLEVENEAENLKVIDTYMGNTQRAVSSLSGGETFKLSLALAFGLSDLAAKNVNIESLFIDEGFGTLDPESLDQAITILENMQNTTNKSIGIISHVGELKDRIGTKIKLVRSGAGYSSIEIE